MMAKKKPKLRIGYYLIYMALSLNLMAVLTIGVAPQEAFAPPPDLMCWELGTCGQFASDPLGTMLTPFDSIFVGFSIVVFWGLLCGILWLRSHNPMLVGIIGVAMVSAYMASDEVLQFGTSPQFGQAQTIGAILILISLAIAVYHIVQHRLDMQPS